MDIEGIAAEAFEVLSTGRQIAPFTDHHPDFGLGDAYQVTAALHRRRLARGERALGRKIGFTNRTIWAEYNVHAPIWGHVYDNTVADLPQDGTAVSLAGLAEPRIEPEIMFGLAAQPEPGMDARALLGCLDWVAHGFEIVQSIFPGWRFLAPDTVAAYGLHGKLLVGPRHPVSADWAENLAGFEIDLFCDGQQVDHGRATNVLDGPVLALRHLVGLLDADRVNPKLAAGEIITTGTLTRAFPVAAGQEWRTALTGLPLPPAAIRFG